MPEPPSPMGDNTSAFDAVNSVFTAFKERLSHPVTGIFALVWLLWNWRMVFFLVVADSPAAARIAAGTEFTGWWVGLVFPALTTIGYIFAAPLLKAGASWWNDWVAARESERIYQGQLVELQHRTEVETRSMQSKQPAIKGQQEQIVRNELRLKQLSEEKQRLEQAIKDLTEMSAPDWSAVLPDFSETGIQPANVMESSTLMALKQRLDRIDELKKVILKKYPSMRWN